MSENNQKIVVVHENSNDGNFIANYLISNNFNVVIVSNPLDDYFINKKIFSNARLVISCEKFANHTVSELLEHLKSFDKKLEVIVVSDNISKREIAKLFKAGVYDVFSVNELDKTDFIEVVNNFFSKKEVVNYTSRLNCKGFVNCQKQYKVFGKAGYGSILVSSGNIIFDANDIFLDICGYTINEIFNKDVGCFLHYFGSDDYDNKEFWNEILENKSSYIETLLICKNGLRKYVEVLIQGYQIEKLHYIHCLVKDISLYKKTEESLSIYELAIQSEISAIIFSSLDGVIFDLNKKFLEFWNFRSEKEVLGKQITELVMSDEDFKKIMSELIGKSTYTGEFDYTSKYFKSFSVRLNAAVLHDKHGNPVAIMYAFANITEQRKQLKALKESKLKMDLFFSYSQDGFYFMMFENPIYWNETIDKETVIEYAFKNQKITQVNAAFLDQYGYTMEQALGATPELFYANNIDEGKKMWRELFDKGHLHTFTKSIKPDGSEIIIEGDYTCFYNEIGQITGHFGSQRDITEKKKYEIALEFSEKKFSTIFNNNPASIAITNLNTAKITDVNNEFLRSMEYSKNEVINKTSSELNIFVDENKRLSFLQNVIENGRAENFEMDLQTKNGHIITGIFSGEIIKINEMPFLLTVMANISERKKFEEKLILSEDKFSKFFQLISAYTIIIRKADNIIIDANAAFLKLMKTDINNVVGKNLSNLQLFTNEEFSEILKLVHTNSPAKDFQVTLNITKLDKRVCLLNIEYSTINNIECYIVVAVDITDRVKNEKQLQKLFLAVENSASIIVITDAQGNIEYVNKKYTEVTLYEADEVIGKNPRFVKSGQQNIDFYKNLWNTVLAGKSWYGEFANFKKNGEIFWEKASISPLKDKYNHITHFVKVSEDITNQKNALEALKKSEYELKIANSTKDKMFSIIAHDLRGPIGNSRALLDLMITNPEVIDNETIKILRDSADSTFNLLENLLFWAKSMRGDIKIQSEKFDIFDLVNEVIYLLLTSSKNKNILLENECTSASFVFADRNMISTVIRNLITNAIKFTLPGGKISISSRKLENFMEIKIQDTGIGMAPEIMAKLFKSESQFSTFGTNQEKGSGLGLLVCLEFVKLHQCKIWVESIENVGSSFFFTLPLAEF